MKVRTRAAGVAALAGVLVLLGVGPARAENATYPDPADAAASLTDIRAVRVNHGARLVVVVVRFTDLRRHSTGGPASLTVGLDTDPAVRGAEFKLVTGLQSGTDYQLLRVRRGHPVGDPLTCPHRVQLRYAEDRAVFRATRSCLDEPAQVRVAVAMRDEWDASHPVTDWLGEPRSWTEPVTAS